MGPCPSVPSQCTMWPFHCQLSVTNWAIRWSNNRSLRCARQWRVQVSKGVWSWISSATVPCLQFARSWLGLQDGLYLAAQLSCLDEERLKLAWDALPETPSTMWAATMRHCSSCQYLLWSLAGWVWSRSHQQRSYREMHGEVWWWFGKEAENCRTETMLHAILTQPWHLLLHIYVIPTIRPPQ